MFAGLKAHNAKRLNYKNIARIAKAALQKLPGKSSLNVRSVRPVCPVLSVHEDHHYNDDHDYDVHGPGP